MRGHSGKRECEDTQERGSARTLRKEGVIGHSGKWECGDAQGRGSERKLTGGKGRREGHARSCETDTSKVGSKHEGE